MPAKDPRDIAADAQEQLSAFRIAISRVFKQGVKKLQSKGRKVHKKLADIHWVEAHVDDKGRVRPLGEISVAWISRKRSLGKAVQRGRFTTGIFRTIKSSRSFKKTKRGFLVDLTLPNLTVRVPFITKTAEPRTVNSYIDFYEEQKAPGMGNLPRRDVVRLNKEVVDFLNERFQRVAKSASLAGKQRVVQVRLIFKGFKI